MATVCDTTHGRIQRKTVNNQNFITIGHNTTHHHCNCINFNWQFLCLIEYAYVFSHTSLLIMLYTSLDSFFPAFTSKNYSLELFLVRRALPGSFFSTASLRCPAIVLPLAKTLLIFYYPYS
jgi:hypothetical protein